MQHVIGSAELNLHNVLNSFPVRLCLICNTLSCGGAGRVASILANGFAEIGWTVRLMTTDDGKAPPLFRLGADVEYEPLCLQHESTSAVAGVFANIRRALTIRQAILGAGSGIVISFLDLTNVLTLLATRGLGIPVIVSERSDPARRQIGRYWEILRYISYFWADALVFPGQRSLSYFPARIRSRSFVIPNPISLPLEGTWCEQARAEPRCSVVAMGRLCYEKGFDLLIRAFARIAPGHPEWALTIWGDGPDRKKLESLIKEARIDNQASLPGVTRQPFSRLSSADLFVLSSRVEGFPNVLVEAMAVGLPVIVTDVGAVPEIVRNGLNGIIVPACDTLALASAMDHLMGKQCRRLELAGRAPEVLNRFGRDGVLETWGRLIVELISRNFRIGRPGHTEWSCQ